VANQLTSSSPAAASTPGALLPAAANPLDALSPAAANPPSCFSADDDKVFVTRRLAMELQQQGEVKHGRVVLLVAHGGWKGDAEKRGVVEENKSMTGWAISSSALGGSAAHPAPPVPASTVVVQTVWLFEDGGLVFQDIAAWHYQSLLMDVWVHDRPLDNAYYSLEAVQSMAAHGEVLEELPVTLNQRAQGCIRLISHRCGPRRPYELSGNDQNAPGPQGLEESQAG